MLEKTRQSLESALRYNPSNGELMASLAEVYVRLGMFDERTMELVEAVLSQQGENPLLQQAQSIGLLIEQTRTLQENLAEGQPPPDPSTIQHSLDNLSTYLKNQPECESAWVAWTRLQLIKGDLVRARKGIERLVRLEATDLARSLGPALLWRQRQGASGETGCHLARIYLTLGETLQAMELLEKLYDDGFAEAGPLLFEIYQRQFSPNQPEKVPETHRQRFFMLLLDHADAERTNQWLRKASLLGWQVGVFSQSYAETLIEHGELDEAFLVLQRTIMDDYVRQLLNQIALRYEEQDDVDKAVAVLRYINDNSLVEQDVQQNRERDLVRSSEISMAELHLKNGRPEDALVHYINALCNCPAPEPDLLRTIEELFDAAAPHEAEPLLRLGLYFRNLHDYPKAIFWLNQALEIDGENREVIAELESLYDDLLQANPDLPQLRLDLGRLYYHTRRWSKAIDELRVAAGWAEQADAANRLLARAYHRDGQINKALDKFKLVTPDEDDCAELFKLYEEFMDQKAWRDAQLSLELIAETHPQFRDVTMRLHQLRARQQPQWGGSAEPAGDPRMRELIGDLAVGRYNYMERLGSGGMGVVHKVFDVRNNRVVAMKILRDSLSSSSKALDRFFREARIAASLSHTNIVNIYDYNISNMSGQSYIVMEYVDGPSLRELVDRQFAETIETPLDYITEILHYSVQLCDALQASHANGVIHRDIKPDNIMITQEGVVKITDFGIVHIEEATFTPSGAMLGTPRYMSPEQVTGGRVDARSDIYSVGILLYEVLTGTPPFFTGDIAFQQVHKDPSNPRELNPKLPESLAEGILRCLMKKPDDRFQDAMELKASLGRILERMGGCAKYSNRTEVVEDGAPFLRAAPVASGTGAAPEGPAVGSDAELDLE
ncbi:MAG: Serine/threonine-protein kinase PknB [candidate division BRC1 bacterium ADurb.BinA292]|nr:MAG: Serine/threonine-protein kinase PknB [candidate division BRC1 bacterium ADurb.BinA292]